MNLDGNDAERLAMWMPGNISPMRIAVLRVRYREKIRHKRKASRWMGISEDRYRGYFNDAIRAIENSFF